MAIAMKSPTTVSIQREMYPWIHSHCTAAVSGIYEKLHLQLSHGLTVSASGAEDCNAGGSRPSGLWNFQHCIHSIGIWG